MRADKRTTDHIFERQRDRDTFPASFQKRLEYRRGGSDQTSLSSFFFDVLLTHLKESDDLVVILRKEISSCHSRRSQHQDIFDLAFVGDWYNRREAGVVIADGGEFGSICHAQDLAEQDRLVRDFSVRNHESVMTSESNIAGVM